MTLGEFVKNRRAELRISQRELAKRSGLSPTYVASIELGANPSTGRPISPTIDALQDLAKGLGVTFEMLAKLARGVSLDAPPLTSEEAQKIVDRAPTWSPEKARQILRLLDALEGDEHQK